LDNGGYFCFTFEEFVEGHELQGDRQSHSGVGTIGPGIPLDFNHHRHSKTEIDEILASQGLTTIEAKRFQAYYKTANMIPIYYWIVLAKLP